MNATIATTKSRGAVPSDASLVAAAKSGDPEAFKPLVERHRPIVLFSAMPLTDSHEDAEDVVQQCIQKGIRSLETVPRQVFIFHLVDTDSAQRGSYAAAEREKAAEYING